MELKECLKYALRVAYKMSGDPEMGSIAGEAAWIAWSFYDPTKGVPEERWIARTVRLAVWDYWRRKAKRKEEQAELWLQMNASTNDEPESDPLPITDWERLLLWERYVDGLSFAIIAKRRGINVKIVTQCIDNTVQRLKARLQER